MSNFRLWKGSVEEENPKALQEEGSNPYEDEDSFEKKVPTLPPRPIFINVDAKNNPIFDEISGVVYCVHMLPYHVNVFLTDGRILEFRAKGFPHTIVNGDTITCTGCQVYVEGNEKGFLFVNCTLRH